MVQIPNILNFACVSSLPFCFQHFHLGLHLLRMILPLIDNTYWLLRADLLSLLGSLNYRQIAYLESHEQVREVAPVQVFVAFIFSCIFNKPSITRKRSQRYNELLGIVGHLSTTLRWGNPAKCLSQRHSFRESSRGPFIFFYRTFEDKKTFLLFTAGAYLGGSIGPCPPPPPPF